MLSLLLTGQLTGVLLVFARLGTAIAFLPGFGEIQVAPRIRLAIAVLITLALRPALPVPDLAPDSLAVVARLVISESLIGLWFGLSARILLSALHFAGSQIGYAAGLSNAFAGGQAAGGFEGATMVAGFLLVAAVATIFATNTHHLMIRALILSYDVMPFGGLMIGDMAREIVRLATGSLRIGITLAAPFFVMGLLLNLGLGLANRMLPSLPVFFVAGSGLIAAGFAILALAVPAMLEGFVTRFAEWLGLLVF